MPKGSWGRLIHPGLGGPKLNPQGVGDGEPVNIPAPLFSVDQGVRFRSLQRADGRARVEDEASGRRQIRVRVKSSLDGGPTGPKEERSGAEKSL